MRIFVTGLMMFIGGLGIGLGFGWSAGKKDSRSVEVQKLPAPSIQESVHPAIATERAIVTKVEPVAALEKQPLAGDKEPLDDLETRLTEIETRLQLLELSDSATEPSVPENRGEINPQNLQQAGFDEFEVSVITDFFNQQQLERLEIRDRATREGWIDSAEFRQQLRENRSQSALKFSLGEDRYDLLLLSQGRNNRVRIDEVMSGSAAQQAGVIAGDVISRYADVTIYNVGELRAATADGVRDEVVTLSVIRNNDELELFVPRGPLGVTVSGILME